jgi:hypothetical protein
MLPMISISARNSFQDQDRVSDVGKNFWAMLSESTLSLSINCWKEMSINVSILQFQVLTYSPSNSTSTSNSSSSDMTKS